MRAACCALVLGCASALDDGIAVSPPMGWRSWNQFGLEINQTLVEQHYTVLADRTRKVDGQLTSLLDLGYDRASIDDGWQRCDSGPSGHGFHNSSGYPIIDSDKFPDMRAMAAKAHSLGVRPGWYANNCHCADHSAICKGGACMQGTVQATTDFGFDSIKMDRAGPQKNASLFAELLNATGRPVLIENNNAVAHRDGAQVVCPMHLFRTSDDMRPTYGRILSNLLSVRHYNEGNLSGPGCWAYPDMLAVGVTAMQPPGVPAHRDCAKPNVACGMNFTEQRTHFGAWCIASSPLVLAMDLRDSAALDAAWPILSNPEAIAINQQWAGDAGRLHNQSSESATFRNCGYGSPCSHASWMVWTKMLPPLKTGAKRVAVFLMNNAPHTATVSADLSAIHGFGGCGGGACAVRDVWARQDAAAQATAVSAALPPHDSALFVVTASR